MPFLLNHIPASARRAWSSRAGVPESQVPRERRGIALAVAIMSLVFIGALVASAFFFTTQNQRVADNAKRQVRAFGVVERGTAEVLRAWKPNWYNARGIYPLDSTRVDSTADTSRAGTYRGNLYRLNQQLYLIDLSATDSLSASKRLSSSGARQRVGTLLRVLPIPVNVSAAMTIGSAVNWGGGNVFVSGTDVLPAGWSTMCPPASGGVYGVRANALGDLGASLGQFSGVPSGYTIQPTPASTFTQYNGATYAQLAAAATKQLGNGSSMSVNPAVSGTTCTTANINNWGDGNTPTGPCGGYFPTMHASGNLTLTGGQGQGILLVDGDLTISGPFNFYGLIIVKGSFHPTAGTQNIIGGLQVGHMNGTQTAFGNNSVNVKYSSCALTRVANATSNATQLRSRGWVRLM